MTRNKKILNLNKLIDVILEEKKKGKTIAFTNGCFDIIHYGHVVYLQKAKELADILVVGINSDNSVKKIKGEKRPINSLKERMGVIAALEAVDFVVPFSETTPYNLIKTIRPDFLVKGGDWKKSDIVGADIVNSYGGKVVTVKYLKGISTSHIINRIVKKFS
ncbi:MAG: D-glycero-beta-D-manno-heptose 1-phosphate adenylyltransferase [Candidatus Omnitrophica bacterium]|nr:D-glycero-beta-D-manno-heptose 1-phosphate adenylyltransferase [Candidatus Omnitrophota bacterium]